MPHALRHDIGDVAVGIQRNEIGIGANHDLALARQPQMARDVAGERRQHRVQRMPARQQLTHGIQQRVRTADIHAAHPAVVIEGGQTAAGIGTDRQAFRRRAGRVITLPGLGR